jgi:hypothetical protein
MSAPGWEVDLESALRTAKREARLVLADFSAPG